MNWFNYCKPVCSYFKVATFSSFFEPEIEKLTEYSEFIEDQLKHMHQQEAKHEAHHGRILEMKEVKEGGAKKRKLVEDPDHVDHEKSFKEGVIF